MNRTITLLISILISLTAFSQQKQQIVIPSYIYDENGDYPTTVTLNDDEWHHYVITKAADRTGKIYVDGELIFEGTYADNAYSYSQFYLGASYYTSWKGFFKGWLDDLKISTRVLTAEEIRQNYTSNAPAIKDASTFALFHFDETSGSNFASEAYGSGVLYNGVQFQEGKFGNALYFDGIDDRGDCRLNIPEDNITMEAWVKRDGAQHDAVAFQAYGMYTTSLLFYEIEVVDPIIEIPDVNFKAYLIENNLINVNGDSEIQLSEANAFSGVINVVSQGISDLSGIEYFENLTELSCSGNSISSLDVSQLKKLENLNCGNNDITQIILSGADNLKSLSVAGNQLTTLGIQTIINLEVLSFQNNQITEIDLSKNVNLNTISCFQNKLETLDLSACQNLDALVCNNNFLTSLDVSNNINLSTLQCHFNQITGLNASNNPKLTQLFCYNNEIVSLDLSKNIALERLYCPNNKIENLDVTNNPLLKTFSCYNNLIQELDLRKNTNLELVQCYDNPLVYLDLRNGNNEIITSDNFDIRNTPDLTCISVSNLEYANSTWINRDAQNVFSSEPCRTSLEDGLVAYYPFNGNANDESGNNGHGIVAGAKLSNDRYGNPNSSYYFDGDEDVIKVSDTHAFDFDPATDSYTVSFWIESDNTNTNNDISIIDKWETPTNSPFTIRQNTTNNYVVFSVYDGIETKSVFASQAFDNKWRMYTMVVNNESKMLSAYLDGTLVYSASINFNHSSINTDILTIGNNPGMYTDYKGKIDDIRIYNRAITIDEISQLKYEGEPLVAHYPFNGNANDESYRQNHGIVSGATLTTDRKGKVESAYYFDGVDDFIQVPDSFPITDYFTISFWALNEKESGTSTVLCDGSSNAGGADFIINLKADKIGVRADKNTSLNYEYSSPAELSGLPIINQWVHVAWVMDEGISTIYFNGVEKYTFNETGSNEGYHDPFSYIGARCVWGNPDEFFKGKIDDIKIYNKPLTASEVYEMSGANNTPTNVEKVNGLGVNIFPNPSNGIVNIRLNDNDFNGYDLEIFSIAGNKVYESKISSSQTLINFKEFANAGVYLVRITNSFAGESLIQKIIIK